MTDEPEACPYLGLPDDSRTRFTFATPAHRCYAKRKPKAIDLGHQGVYCLSSAFPTCNRFPAPTAAVAAKTERARAAGPVVGITNPEMASAPVVPLPAAPSPAVPAATLTNGHEPSVAPEALPSPAEPTPRAAQSALPSRASPTPGEPAGSSPAATLVAVMAETPLSGTAPDTPVRRQPWLIETRPVYDTRNRIPDSAPLAALTRAQTVATEDRAESRGALRKFASKRTRQRIAVLLPIALVVAVLAFADATGLLVRLLPARGLPGAVAVPSATGAGIQLTTPPSLVASTAPTAAASPSVTVSPSASPTAATSPSAAAPIIHIVQPGEFLSMIAAQYGVTPQAVARANHLKDYNLLRVGQKLIIPPAP